jgi:hypothetical protein
MRSLRFLLLLAALGVAAPASAFVPQTIVLDGTNDFDPGNLLDDDRNDTQQGCSPAALPMDLGRVYVTNDNNYVYFGIEFSKTCYCDMNLGLSIDVNSAGGGTTDPFGRKIGWTNLAFKPDWVVYDVTPTNCNTFNYEILYKDSLGTWYNRSQYVNPSWGSGSNGLGIADGDNFKEIRLPLSVLGASVGTPLRLEFWVTQEGATKGPLDALCSDNVQMSRATTTTYDTTAVVEMTCQLSYTVLNAVDNTAPTVSSAIATGFTVLANKQFALGTNKVDVTFSEPVDLATSQNTANYAYSGPSVRTVVGAVRDGAALNVVHLTLNSAISANAAFHNITVTGVKDIAGNTIINNGTTNVGSGFIQNVTFNGNMALNICSGNFAASDTFAIEGNVAPLSFNLCDNAFMYDANADSIFTVTVPFSLPKNPVSGVATADLEWKMTRLCNTYEPFPGNRTYTLSSANGSAVTLNVVWNNDVPANFLNAATTVRFRVNAAHFNPTGSDVITLLGNIAPLSFTQPGIAMLDNGVAPDAVAGDKIYTAQVTFPKCSSRGIEWKVDFNGLIECADQSNRSFFILPAQDGTTLTLPARGIDRCTVTDKAVAVTFRVDMAVASPDPLPGDTVAVMGGPLSFNTPPVAAQIMKNDGVPPDASASDRVWTRTVTFPDSTPMTMEYKYWFNKWATNNGFECEGFGNRTLLLDDLVYSAGNPLVLVQNGWNSCTQTLDVPDVAGSGEGPAFAVMRPSFPVPFSTRTSIHFDLKRSGRVTVSVYDISGRRVAKLIDGELSAGPQSLTWDGRDENGARMRSGIYLAVITMKNERVSGRLVLAR